MPEILAHPALPGVVFILLAFYPAARLLRRAGLSPWFALLLPLSLLMPFLGIAAVAGVMAHARWPALPLPEKRPLQKILGRFHKEAPDA